MAVEAERADHEPLVVAQQKVGQVERAGLGVGELREYLRRRKELVAVGARQPLDTLLAQHRIELPTGTAVAVDDEDLRIAIPVRPDLGAHRGRDAFGPVMQLRGEAAYSEHRPAVRALERGDLAPECPAGDEQGVGTLGHRRRLVQAALAAALAGAPAAARRLASRLLAVSTAIAASRQ